MVNLGKYRNLTSSTGIKCMRPLYAIHTTKAGLPLLNYETTIWQFCVCHDFHSTLGLVSVKEMKERALSEVPRCFPVWSWARRQDWEVFGYSSFRLSPPPHWPALFPRERWCSRSCLPESALTIYTWSMGSIRFYVPGLSLVPWLLTELSHLGVWIPGQREATQDPWVCLKTDLAGGHQTSWL